MKVHVPWVKVSLVVAQTIGDLARSLQAGSDGGKTVTEDEWEEMKGRALLRFGGLLDDVFPFPGRPR